MICQHPVVSKIRGPASRLLGRPRLQEESTRELKGAFRTFRDTNTTLRAEPALIILDPVEPWDESPWGGRELSGDFAFALDPLCPYRDESADQRRATRWWGTH